MKGWEIQALNASKTKVSILWNPYAEVPSGSCVVEETVGGEDTLSYVTHDLDTHATNLTAETAFIRLVNLDSPSEKRTYVIITHDLVHEEGQKALVVKGERIWVHLRDRYIYPNTRDFVNLALSTLLTEILNTSGANAEFQIGTVASPSEVVDFFTINHHSVLWAFRSLVAKMGREMSIDESTTPITLNFPSTIGATTSARFRYGLNLQGITRKTDKSRMVTRLYAIGGGTPSMKLSASSLAGGLDYVQDAALHALYSRVDVYHNPDLEDIENIIPAANNPDLSGTYTAGLCAGWTKIGTPTVSENTNATFYQRGTKSQKVVATDTQGVQTTFTASTTARMVAWVNIYVESLAALAKVRVEVTDGTARFLNGDGITTTGAFVAEERRGIEFTGSSGTLKVYAEGGNATFYADAAFVAVAEEFKKFVIGDMADILYNEALDELNARKNPEVTYSIDALDLYEADAEKWSDYQVRLGDTVKVEDNDLDITVSQRIKKRTWNVIRPEKSGFDIGNVVVSLGNLMTDDQQQFRATLERTRTSQDKSERAGAALSVDRPITALVARFSGVFSSTAYNAFSWTAGTLTVGTDLVYAIGSGSISGLTASTTYYLYFDLDAPASSLQVTTTYTTSVGPRKASVATAVTSASTQPGCTIITTADGKPQLSGTDIVTGILTVGASPSATDRITMSWVTKDLVMYRGGAAVVDLGDIAGNPLAHGDIGLVVNHEKGLIYVLRDGPAGTVPGGTQPVGIMANVVRDADGEADTVSEVGIMSRLYAANRSVGQNGVLVPFRASAENVDGKAIGFQTYSDISNLGIKSSVDSYGFYANLIEATNGAGDATGVYIAEVTGGSVSGTGYGLRIANAITATANKRYAIYSESVEPSVLSGVLRATRSTTSEAASIQAENTNGGAFGATIGTKHSSSTPAAADIVGRFEVLGHNLAGGEETVARLDGIWKDLTAGLEDASVELYVMQDGIAQKLAEWDALNDKVVFKGTVKPNADATWDLGESGARFIDGYFSNALNVGPADAGAGNALISLKAGATGQTGIQFIDQATNRWTIGANNEFGTDGFYFYDDVSDRYSFGLPTSGDAELRVQGRGLVVVPDNANGPVIADDLTKKRLSVTKMASAPTQGAYIAFTQNPGSDIFYLILGDV